MSGTILASLQVPAPPDGGGQYQTLEPQVMPMKPTASVYQASPVVLVSDGFDEVTTAFEDAGALHPDVVAYRARHRQDMRDFRERMKRHKEETEGDE